MARKQVDITLFDGDPITIIGENSWGAFFPEVSNINERIKSGDKFISIKDKDENIYTIFIDNIKSVQEITLEKTAEDLPF